MDFIKNNKSTFLVIGVAVVSVGLWALYLGGNGSTEGDEDVAQAIAELVEESKEQATEEIVVEVSKTESLAEKANEAAIVNQGNEAVKNSVDSDYSDEE